MKFSNKCCADAWSVPSLIISDMRAPGWHLTCTEKTIRWCPLMGTIFGAASALSKSAVVRAKAERGSAFALGGS
jgi:hypothetical protein